MCYSPAYSWSYSVRVLALRLQMALNRHLQPLRRVQVLGCSVKQALCGFGVGDQSIGIKPASAAPELGSIQAVLALR